MRSASASVGARIARRDQLTRTYSCSCCRHVAATHAVHSRRGRRRRSAPPAAATAGGRPGLRGAVAGHDGRPPADFQARRLARQLPGRRRGGGRRILLPAPWRRRGEVLLLRRRRQQVGTQRRPVGGAPQVVAPVPVPEPVAARLRRRRLLRLVQPVRAASGAAVAAAAETDAGAREAPRLSAVLWARGEAGFVQGLAARHPREARGAQRGGLLLLGQRRPHHLLLLWQGAARLGRQRRPLGGARALVPRLLARVAAPRQRLRQRDCSEEGRLNRRQNGSPPNCDRRAGRKLQVATATRDTGQPSREDGKRCHRREASLQNMLRKGNGRRIPALWAHRGLRRLRLVSCRLSRLPPTLPEHGQSLLIVMDPGTSRKKH